MWIMWKKCWKKIMETKQSHKINKKKLSTIFYVNIKNPHRIVK